MIDRSHGLPLAGQAHELGGSRTLRDLLRQEGIEIGRQHAATLMKKMPFEAIYCRPNTSKSAPGHKIDAYQLRKLPIVRLNQALATDVGQISMTRGFIYLVAIVDWFSRKVISHRRLITMEVDFCVEVLARNGKLCIFNTDQGGQFTLLALTSVLRSENIAISRDGRGAWRDNAVVERLGRSVKCEEVHLRASASLGARISDRAYFGNLPLAVAA